MSNISIWSEELAISRARLDKTIINRNQASTSIDRRGHIDWDFSFKSQKSCKDISFDFWRKTNDIIVVNPWITIGRIIPQITRTAQGIFDVFNYIRGTLDIAYRSASWLGKEKSESEKFGGNNILENAELKNNFEVGRVEHKNL